MASDTDKDTLYDRYNKNVASKWSPYYYANRQPLICTVVFGVECTVCIETIDGTAVETPCRHTFHPGCIESWLQVADSCPLCRASLG